jgi:hypothetical protein
MSEQIEVVVEPKVEEITGESPVEGDNIDDDLSAEQIDEMLRDMEAREAQQEQSLVDMYVSQIKGDGHISYNDPTDDYYSQIYSRSHDFNEAEKQKSRSSMHPSTANYERYSHNSDFDFNEAAEMMGNMELALDNIGDKTELIYDHVKSSDTLINDMYERNIGMDEDIQNLKETIKNINNRTFRNEAMLATIRSDQVCMKKMMTEMRDWLSHIRFGDE